MPVVRAAMLVATACCAPPWLPPPAGCALGGVAPDAAVCGVRAGAGAGLGDEAEHAVASNVATAPNERAARMSVELCESDVGDERRECPLGASLPQAASLAAACP